MFVKIILKLFEFLIGDHEERVMQSLKNIFESARLI